MQKVRAMRPDWIACARCAYYQPDAPTDLRGTCRRIAPSTGDTRLNWPTVLETDWCADFTKAENFDWQAMRSPEMAE